MLTKEECINALENILFNVGVARSDYRTSGKAKEDYCTLNSLIEEHFDNSPLKVADIPLEEEIMCWDNVEKEWCSIYSEGGEVSIAYFQLPTVYTMYETFDKKHGNRFYRKEVHE